MESLLSKNQYSQWMQLCLSLYRSPDLLYFGKRDLPLLPVCEKQHLMRHLKTGKLMFFAPSVFSMISFNSRISSP